MRTNRSRLRSEAFRRDMIATGQLLFDVLSLEQYLARAYSRKPTTERLQDWQRASRALKHLTLEYIRTVARYRRTLKKCFLRKPVSKR